LEQLRKVALASACTLGFVLDPMIEFACRVPEKAERPLATSVVPNACGHDTMRPGHARHLAKPSHRVRHEVNDKLGESGVKHLISKRQLLGRRPTDTDAGVPLLHRCNKRFRGIDRSYGGRPEPPGQLGGQRTRAATDIEHKRTSRDPREIGELRRERR